ncbi:MAG: hypothetical protein ABI670_15030 [Chloroflexota bacterium]
MKPGTPSTLSLWSALLVFFVAFTTLAAPSMAAPARQYDGENEVGPVEALALDSTGNGWAWAEFAPQRPGTNYLVRIDNGQWRIAEDTTTQPTLLPSGLTMYKMVLTAKGDDGWAVGRTTERYPVLWRYQAGSWKTVKLDVPASARIASSLTINADGTDGWMSVYDMLNDEYVLLRLRNGAWKAVPQVKGGMIAYAAISPDGKSGWGTGRYGTTPVDAVFKLENGVWVSPPIKTFEPRQVATDVTADNAGGGWALVNNTLVRLNADKSTAVAYTAPDKVTLRSVAVDASGRGWALADKDLGEVEQPGGFEYPREAITLRLNGDKAAQVEPASASFPKDIWPRVVAVTPDGGQAWAGANDKVGYGSLINFREPWPYGGSNTSGNKGPDGMAPLPGRGRCFAEVQFCLRGAFLAFWEKNGGLEQLGLPITTEVSATIDGKDYLVQYTERARLEYHPENKGKPGEVLLGLLGNILVEPRLNEVPFGPFPAPASSGAGTQYFQQTSHNVGAPFLGYWKAKGGLPLFGYPRSEAFAEQNQVDGKTYHVQYFERNRIEYHPENVGTRYEFLLGLLGAEQFKATYGFAP